MNCRGISTKWRAVLPALAAVVILGSMLAACNQTVETPSPEVHVQEIATPASKAPGATLTPSPRPTLPGVQSPEDLRALFDRWPEEYKFAVDEDVTVRFTYPSQSIDWVGFAFIDHIPSASSMSLRRPLRVTNSIGGVWIEEGEDLWGEETVIDRQYESDEGEARLKAVLDDEALMRRILSRADDTNRK